MGFKVRVYTGIRVRVLKSGPLGCRGYINISVFFVFGHQLRAHIQGQCNYPFRIQALDPVKPRILNLKLHILGFRGRSKLHSAQKPRGHGWWEARA